MAVELQDRLNWQQACTVLGCSKTTLYKLVREKLLKSYGTGARYRWFSRGECVEYIETVQKEKKA